MTCRLQAVGQNQQVLFKIVLVPCQLHIKTNFKRKEYRHFGFPDSRNHIYYLTWNSYLSITWDFIRRMRFPGAHPHIPVITNYWYHERHIQVRNGAGYSKRKKKLWNSEQFFKSQAIILPKVCVDIKAGISFPEGSQQATVCKSELALSIDRFLSTELPWKRREGSFQRTTSMSHLVT